MALDGAFDVIVHGCNCQCVMGAGIAKSIKAAFAEAYAADLRTIKGDSAKLGTITFATVCRAGRRFSVANAYTQYHWRGRAVLADYGAIRSAMSAVKSTFTGKRIGYPLIGAGLAVGDWQMIATIIEQELEGEDHTLVEYMT